VVGREVKIQQDMKTDCH